LVRKEHLDKNWLFWVHKLLSPQRIRGKLVATFTTSINA